MEPTATLSLADVRTAMATCIAAGRRPGLRPVWRELVASTGRRPSFSTVSRLLAEAQNPETAPPEQPATPEPVVAQLQQLGPAVWAAALAQARQAVAAETARQNTALAAAAERERDLLAELDEAQARAASADEQRQEALRQAEAAQAQVAAAQQTLTQVTQAQQQAAAAWAERERELGARLGQLERETATMAAALHHARDGLASAGAARDRLQDELREAQRRADADLALNAHLREQLATRDEDLAGARRQLAAGEERIRQAEIRALAGEQARRTRDPLVREVLSGLRRLERRMTPG